MASPARIAVIPARGGSRRLLRKNVADFLGRPILAWTVAAARDSGLFARIVVSTEDADIAAVARAAGAEVAERPARLADDVATVLDVCLDLLERESSAGRDWDVLCALYATAPLRNADDIRAVVGLLEPGRCDFAMAVTEYDLPPYRALRQDADGTLVPIWPDLVARKSQDVPPLVVNNGSTYAVRVAALRAHRTFTGPGCRGHLMPRARSVDVDVAEDLEMARWHAQRLGLTGGAAAHG